MARKRFRGNLFQGTNQPGPGDGQDPRYDHLQERRSVPNRKALQLSAQVAETLALVLAAQADDLLRDLLVESVCPFPTSARLLVTLVPAVSAAQLDLSLTAERLQSVQGALRSEVAAAISRRKVPDLVFRVLNADDPRR
jgi:ribosome-binding factor A